MTDLISFEDFLKVELRVGTIKQVEVNEKAIKPSFKLWIDFGEALGIKQSSAQITSLYDLESLIGKQVVAVTNFPPKKVAGFKSEVLVTGFETETGVVLISPDVKLPNGLLLR
jgi:tRNA-binding protein